MGRHTCWCKTCGKGMENASSSRPAPSYIPDCCTKPTAVGASARVCPTCAASISKAGPAERQQRTSLPTTRSQQELPAANGGRALPSRASEAERLRASGASALPGSSRVPGSLTLDDAQMDTGEPSAGDVSYSDAALPPRPPPESGGKRPMATHPTARFKVPSLAAARRATCPLDALDGSIDTQDIGADVPQ